MDEWNKKSRRQVPFVEPVGGNHLEINRTCTHATRGGECRQEGGERGYYHLHRKLNQALLRHNFS